METLTDIYWNKYEEQIYQFCFSLLGKESQAVVCCAEVYRIFSKIMELPGNELEEEKNSKAFFYKTTMDICFNRLRHNKFLRQNKWYHLLFKKIRKICLK